MPAEERPYYAIMGITKSATQEEVRRAYRQKVLIYHPDKAGPEGKERFQFLQQAYSVLSDEKKRKVYDQFGEKGLEMPGADELGAVLGSQIAGSVLCLLVLCMIILIILFLSFLCARVDHTTDWRWTSVWVPAYIFLIIVAVPLVFGLFCIPCMRTAGDPPPADASEEEAEALKRRAELAGSPTVEKLSKLCNTIGALGWIVFFVTISAGLQRHMEGMTTNWWHYFIPVFIAEGCFMGSYLLSFFFERLNIGHLSRAFAGIPKGWLLVWSFFEFLVLCCRIVQLCLICAKVQTDITSSWWVVFIPSYVMLFCSVCFIMLSSAIQKYLMVSLSCGGDPEAAAMLTGGALAVTMCTTCCSATFALGIVYASVFMIIARLNGADIRLDYCLIPIFIIIAFAFLFACCGCVYCCCSAGVVRYTMSEMEEGRRKADENGDAPVPAGPDGQMRADEAAAREANAEGEENGPVLAIEGPPAEEGPHTPNAPTNDDDGSVAPPLHSEDTAFSARGDGVGGID